MTEYRCPSDTTEKFKDDNGNLLGISKLEVGNSFINEYTDYTCNIEKIENENDTIIITFSYNELYLFYLDGVTIKDKDGKIIDKDVLKLGDTILLTKKRFGDINDAALSRSIDNMALIYLSNVRNIQLIENN